MLGRTRGRTWFYRLCATYQRSKPSSFYRLCRAASAVKPLCGVSIEQTVIQILYAPQIPHSSAAVCQLHVGTMSYGLQPVWSLDCPMTVGTSMREQVRLDGLLFSNDAQVVCVMNQILSSFAIDAEVCTEFGSALDAVTHRRLDTVIVDWSGADPTRIVRGARKSSPNSNSTIVAMVDDESETHALLVGANFMIHKPVDLDHARRCMRAAYGTMLQQRRRAARVSVDIPVIARVSDVGSFEARISDISVGGLALQFKQSMAVDREISVLFPLPGTNHVMHTTGKVVNANSNGRAGVRFSMVPDEELTVLENWLASELAKLEQAEMPADPNAALKKTAIHVLS